MKVLLHRLVLHCLSYRPPRRRTEHRCVCVRCLRVESNPEQLAQWVRILTMGTESVFCRECAPAPQSRDFWARLKRCRRVAARRARAAWN